MLDRETCSSFSFQICRESTQKSLSLRLLFQVVSFFVSIFQKADPLFLLAPSIHCKPDWVVLTLQWITFRGLIFARANFHDVKKYFVSISFGEYAFYNYFARTHFRKS